MTKQNERVKKTRQEMNLSQSSLADMVGCTQSMISKIESGEKKPSDKLKISISKILDKSIEWLFFETFYA